MTLLMIVPTRRRRANLDRFLASWEATRTTSRLLIVTEDGDDSYDLMPIPFGARTVETEPGTLTEKLNRYAVPAARSYDAVGFLADDCICETHGWDEQLLAALATPGIAWPTSGRQDLGEHQAISSLIISALGWYFPPQLAHYWTDNAVADIGRGAGCYRQVPAVIRHDHKPDGISDETYEAAEASGDADAAAYQAWRRDGLPQAVVSVRAAITGAQ